MKNKLTLTATVFLLCTLFVSGCVDNQESSVLDDGWQPQRSKVNPHIYLSEVNQMLYPDQAESDAIEKAGESFLINCMKEKGFEYKRNKYNSVMNFNQRGMPEKSIESVYSYSSPEDAAKYGVAAPGWYEGADYKEKFEAEQRPPGYDDALVGKNFDPGDKNSCMYKAEAKITPNNGELDKLMDQLSAINLDVRWEEKPEAKKAEKKWSACMAKKGFPQMKTVDGMSSPSGDPDGKDWPAPNPGAEEVKAATASSLCMTETGYLETVTKLDAKLVHKELQKKPGLITKWKKLREQQLKAAEAYSKERQ